MTHSKIIILVTNLYSKLLIKSFCFIYAFRLHSRKIR